MRLFVFSETFLQIYGKGGDLMTIEQLLGIKEGEAGLANYLGVHEVRVGNDGSVAVDMKITKDHLNPRGMVHGGTISALCDIAIGCFHASRGEEAVALNSELHFFKPGLDGSTLTATVYERKKGHTICTFLIEVRDDSGRHVADGMYTTYKSNTKE